MVYIYHFFRSIIGFVEEHYEACMPILKSIANAFAIVFPLALIAFFVSSPWLTRFILKDQKRIKISKRIIAHLLCLLFDIVAIFAVWFGIKNTFYALNYINVEFDMNYLSLIGGYMFVFLIAPALHAIVTISHLKPGFVKKHSIPISAIAFCLIASLSWLGYYIQDTIRIEYEDRYYERCAILEKKYSFPMYAAYLRDPAQCDAIEKYYKDNPPIELTEEDKEYNRNAKVIVIE